MQPQTPMGLIRVRNHCLFTWEDLVDPPNHRVVHIHSQHCQPCIEELKRMLAPSVTLEFSEEGPKLGGKR